MNLPFFIARRYLFSRKKQHVINIISGIAATGICIGTFALVVVLSVFNGFDGLIKSWFSQLDPDLKVVPVEGKFFDPGLLTDTLLIQIDGIEGFSAVIEGNTLLSYEGRQFIATMKGVDKEFNKITGIDSLIIDGTFLPDVNQEYFAVPGQGVASYLGISLDFSTPVSFYVPSKEISASPLPEKALKYGSCFPCGVFALLEEVDASTVFVEIGFAQELFETNGKISALEIKVLPEYSVRKVRKAILEATGNNFLVKTKYQQHDSLYKTMKMEKWVTYLILAFILVIASFNILGSLSMLIIDKKEDIMILQSMGASRKMIRKIFQVEGWLIALAGTTAGIILGLAVCMIQIRFGVIPLPGEGSFVISAYPVKIKLTDILIISTVVLSIGFLAAWYPATNSGKKELNINPALREKGN